MGNTIKNIAAMNTALNAVIVEHTDSDICEGVVNTSHLLVTATETEDKIALSVLVVADLIPEFDSEAATDEARMATLKVLGEVPLTDLIVRGSAQKIHKVLDKAADKEIEKMGLVKAALGVGNRLEELAELKAAAEA